MSQTGQNKSFLLNKSESASYHFPSHSDQAFSQDIIEKLAMETYFLKAELFKICIVVLLNVIKHIVHTYFYLKDQELVLITVAP